APRLWRRAGRISLTGNFALEASPLVLSRPLFTVASLARMIQAGWLAAEAFGKAPQTTAPVYCFGCGVLMRASSSAISSITLSACAGRALSAGRLTGCSDADSERGRKSLADCLLGPMPSWMKLRLALRWPRTG